MNKSSPLRTQNIMLSVVALALITADSQSVLAQQQTSYKAPVDPAAAPPRVKAMVEAINQRGRELGLIVTDDDDQAAFIRRRLNAQLTEDFEKLHSISLEKLVTQSSSPTPDYKTLSDATADLKARATRIKYNVPVLQVVDKGEKIKYDEYPDCLSSMLPDLSRLINTFLGSAVFRLNSPNDVALRLKASRDLDGIIKLSETINKVAKRLARTAASR